MRSPLRAAALLSLAVAASVRAAGPAPDLENAPSRYASVDGVRVHYKLIGHGQRALLFVHGFGGDMTIWREQVTHFAPLARVIVLDLPGHGKSDKPEMAYTMKFMSRAVKAVLEDARVDRAILVGHSAGVAVIRQFDRSFPWKTRALVAVDGVLWMSKPAEAGEKPIANMKSPDYATNINALLDGMMPVADKDVKDTVLRAAAAMPQHVAVSYMTGMFDPAAWKDDRIVVPLLVLNQGGSMWNDDYVRGVRTMADDVDYQTIDGVDHFLMLEKPSEFNTRLDKWLARKKLLR